MGDERSIKTGGKDPAKSSIPKVGEYSRPNFGIDNSIMPYFLQYMNTSISILFPSTICVCTLYQDSGNK